MSRWSGWSRAVCRVVRSRCVWRFARVWCRVVCLAAFIHSLHSGAWRVVHVGAWSCRTPHSAVHSAIDCGMWNQVLTFVSQHQLFRALRNRDVRRADAQAAVCAGHGGLEGRTRCPFSYQNNKLPTQPSTEKMASAPDYTSRK